jgi:bifunctional pyridoxal-dependent enzyme with beta-cystathionase and maltose regulon repressor activities
MVKLKVENESKQERFKRIATGRANRVLDDLRLLGNCSNTSAYAYSEQQVKKIFNTIEEELKIVKMLFNKKNTRKKIEL